MTKQTTHTALVHKTRIEMHVADKPMFWQVYILNGDHAGTSGKVGHNRTNDAKEAIKTVLLDKYKCRTKFIKKIEEV